MAGMALRKHSKGDLDAGEYVLPAVRPGNARVQVQRALNSGVRAREIQLRGLSRDTRNV